MLDKWYKGNKLFEGVCIEYGVIHACPNDCWLYKEESSNGTHCFKCRSSHFREELQEVTTLHIRYWCMALNPRLEDMF